ncbi:hypothetical protein [Plebeiibacterium sediminum]|uniref:Uncharacterized protein n=1 Tax=Plebeiibacterium sediminum TaxID=2992112 RepID=A0AAE3SH05_9BACT|nr:hypothetical protein [Plebeiobacterium sediminum]MCW3789060.1 hypothetical protein [Plebeiobacterium sediminum]
MKYLSISILFFLLLSSAKSFGQQYDFVKILPGIGIVYNSDSIFLNKTTITELHQILKIKENSNPNVFVITMWDGYDSETLESISGTEYTREINFKSITFEFADETDKDNLKLRCITMKEDNTLKIYTDNGLMLGMTNPEIREFYPLTRKKDFISENGLNYNLYKYGISLQLEKLENNDMMLIEISTHVIFE